jgi:hypothetical protein
MRHVEFENLGAILIAGEGEMQTTPLLEMLINIEGALSKRDLASVHTMVLDAEEYILKEQRRRTEIARRGSWPMRLFSISFGHNGQDQKRYTTNPEDD